MRRLVATALVAAMSGGVLIGLSSPSVAAAPASPVDPIGKVVQTAVQDVDTLLCELFGNTVLCGAA